MLEQLQPVKEESSRDMIFCRLCNEEIVLHLAVKNGWTKCGKYYFCPECKKELTKPLDAQHST